MFRFLTIILLTGAPALADATVQVADLTTTNGVASVGGEWRYHDAALSAVEFREADANGQPLGARSSTWEISPRAGIGGYDASAWPIVQPESLAQRRGPGRVSFGWYRFSFTVPERLGTLELRGARVHFETRLDDYAEVWVDGEIGRAQGQQGGSVVAGWNALNRVLVNRHVTPGQRIDIAVFGMNGPVSDAPTNYIYIREARLVFERGEPGPATVTPHEVNVRIERVDPAIDSIVPANAKLFKLAEGFTFTEGPVWVRDGNYLLFSDPNENRIYRYTDQGELSVFRERSGYAGSDIAEYRQPGSNGLTLDRQGRLTINEHGRRRVIRIERDQRETVLAAAYDGQRLNSPNDLVYRSDGTLYFTDPPFGLPRVYDDPRKQLSFSGVYRLSGKQLQLLVRDLKGPNGIALSPDERSLYIGNWDPAAKVVLRYPVRRDGSIGSAETFVDLTARIPGDEALDGIKVDQQGNVYLSAPGGVWIFNSAGRHLGTIVAPKPVHNFAWGGSDGTDLYLCARSALYRIRLLVPGVRP
jgi:gluconolactonase